MKPQRPILAAFAKKLGCSQILVLLALVTLVGCATPPPVWLGGPDQSPVLETASKDDGSSAVLARKEQETEQIIQAPELGTIPLVMTTEVRDWVNYFRGKSNRTFERWAARGEPMREKMQRILKTKGLPKELYYLAMVESGFIHGISSPKKARGPWQLIPETARLYGLKVTKKVDERIDPEKSTLSAANYLRTLFLMFNDWHLTMAAYNAGPKKILDLMKTTKAKDYWTLAKSGKLRSETLDFVPKVLAAIIVGENHSTESIRSLRDPMRLSFEFNDDDRDGGGDGVLLLHHAGQKQYAAATQKPTPGNKQSKTGSRHSG